jgi:hypothetical protein
MKLYVVKSQDGKYYRPGRTHWVDIERAKIFNKIGGARAVVTYWAREWPAHGIPLLVELTVTETSTTDESQRVLDASVAKAERSRRRKLRAAETAAARAADAVTALRRGGR